MLNMACRIWHDIVFGLLNSAQHYAETSPVGGEAEQAANERERGRGGRLRPDRKERKGKWRTSSQMRIGMDLGTDES